MLKSVKQIICPKTCVLDPIPTSLLSECSDLIVPLLTATVNQSSATSIFPSCMKAAKSVLCVQTFRENCSWPTCSKQPLAHLIAYCPKHIAETLLWVFSDISILTSGSKCDFSTINHNSLLTCLKNTPYLWSCSVLLFLPARRDTVNEIKFSLSLLACGEPQGCVLASVLFIWQPLSDVISHHALSPHMSASWSDS